MSRCYEIKIEIDGVEQSRKDVIQKACSKAWNFEKEDWFCDEDYNTHTLYMEASSQGFLCGGESEANFAQRISIDIWKANGGYCPITINALNLDELPYERHAMDEEAYRKLI